jgi:hypothetical protein
MSKHLFFVHPCPTCGRRLHVNVEHLGKKVGCPHCGGRIEVCDPDGGKTSPTDGSSTLMQRVEELLEAPPTTSREASRLSHPR